MVLQNALVYVVCTSTISMAAQLTLESGVFLFQLEQHLSKLLPLLKLLVPWGWWGIRTPSGFAIGSDWRSGLLVVVLTEMPIRSVCYETLAQGVLAPFARVRVIDIL